MYADCKKIKVVSLPINSPDVITAGEVESAKFGVAVGVAVVVVVRVLLGAVVSITVLLGGKKAG